MTSGTLHADTQADDIAAADANSDGPAVPLLGISGTILDRSGAEAAEIEPLIWFDGTPSLEAGGAGNYAVVLRDGAGAALARHAFTPVFGPVDGGRLAGFLFAVPRPDGVAAVALVHGGAEIGALARSQNAPSVAFTRSAVGGNAGGAIDVGWAGQDADGGRLTYRLLYAADVGQAWLPLLVDTTRTAYTLPADDLPRGPDARLRVVVSDGFHQGQIDLGVDLDGAQRVLATVPEDGAVGVAPRGAIGVIVRDPLDPATVNARTFVLRDVSGRAGAGDTVPGRATYQPLDGSVWFEPAAPLAEAHRYEARLTTDALTADGRALAADHVWRFTTRGRAIFLPRALQSGNTRPATAAPSSTPPARTPRPSSSPDATRMGAASRTPTATGRPTESSTPSATSSRSSTATATGQPTSPSSATPTPSSAPSSTSTATNQATLPSTPSPTLPPPSPSATPAGSVVTTIALTTGADPNRVRQAFAPGEAIQLWVGVANDTGASVTADFEFVVVGDNGFAPDTLAWRGSLPVPIGTTGFKLERTVPAGMPAGPYRLLASVTFGGRLSTATSDFFVADALQRADDFADPGSGWTSNNDANVRSGYLGGVFQFLVRTAGFWRFDTPHVSAADFALEADVTFVGDAAGAAGLVSGISADSQSFVVFSIVRDGRFGLFRRSAGAWQTVLPFAASAHVDRDANHLMLTRKGSEVRLYANGQQLAVTFDSTGTSGRLGLYGEGVAAGLDARFDDFRLYRVR